MPAGDVACFSLHPRKVVTVGDGGVLTTHDAELDARFRLLRQHGMTVPDTVRHGSPQVIFESYEAAAFNYRLTDIQAAVGIEQLKRLPEIVSRRRALAERYRERIAAEVPEVAAPVEPNRVRTNWQSYAVRLPDGADQRAVMQSMLDRGIATRRGIMCIHREKPYAGTARFPLPVSEDAQDRTILLPLYPQMTEAEQDQVIDALQVAVRAVNRVRVVILGASGNALDILDIIDALGAPWQAVGVLDDGRDKGGQFAGLAHPRDALRRLHRWRMSASSTASPANAPIAASSQIIAGTGLEDERFVTLIHPLAAVSRRVTIGHGSCIGPGCAVSGRVEIGAHAWLGSHAVIGHECVLRRRRHRGAFRDAGGRRDARRTGLCRFRRRAAARHHSGRRRPDRHGRGGAEGCAARLSSLSAIRPDGSRSRALGASPQDRCIMVESAARQPRSVSRNSGGSRDACIASISSPARPDSSATMSRAGCCRTGTRSSAWTTSTPTTIRP